MRFAWISQGIWSRLPEIHQPEIESGSRKDLLTLSVEIEIRQISMLIARQRRSSFCTRQFEVSATYSSRSVGQASACAPEN